MKEYLIIDKSFKYQKNMLSFFENIGKKYKNISQKLYYNFLTDLKVAFDKVNRKILFKKMRDIGIQGNMIILIEEIYKLTKNKLPTGNEEEEKKYFWTGK